MTNDLPYTVGDYFGVVRRRWVYLATIIPAAILVSVYLAYTLPPMYRSSATILLEPSSIPQDLIRTTVTAYADQQLELVSRRVLTSESLAELVKDVNPYPNYDELSLNEKARFVYEYTETERVDPVTLEPLPESNAFSIHFYNEDPEIARDVTARLADMFLSYNRESRTQQATDTYDFLKTQSEEASAKVAELEQRLANFKSKYGNALPETQTRSLQALDRIENEFDTLQQQILLANERKRSLELQLGQINPNLFDPAGDWRTELATLRADLAAAQQRYTADHPDVRRLRRAIKALSARVNDTDSEKVVPDNPEYIQVANQLKAVNRELSVLESSAARAREQRQNFERSLQIAPEVEREYNQLLREYEGALDRFQGIEASLSEAAMGQVLESESRGDRLTLIRPANYPTSPYSPNRIAIILLGIVLGGGLAVGLVAIAESSDPTIRSARDLTDISDIRPLAAIPYMPNAADKRRRLLTLGVACVAAAAALMVVGLVVYEATI